MVPQTDDDESTTYELLAPGSGEFHVRYAVSAMTPGATAYYNPLRKGSGVRDMRAIDLFSGTELTTDVVPGTSAREGGHPTARPDVDYLEIQLARPVPEGGQARIVIEKVYQDPRGYFLEDGFEDGRLVFARAMNIRRNAVVLPPDYELTQCNHPTRIFREADGRVRVSFDKTGQSPVFLILKARPLPGVEVAGERNASSVRDASAGSPVEDDATRADVRTLAPDRELLIDLGNPRHSTFLALHDFTESEAGRSSRQVASAPPGTVARTRARLLDNGDTLESQVVRQDTDAGRRDAVQVSFPAIEAGRSVRVRVEEVRIDRKSYRLEDDELVWRAQVDSALRSVLLPAGWYITGNTVPAVVVEMPDGRIRLNYATLSADSVEVTVRARERAVQAPESAPTEDR